MVYVVFIHDFLQEEFWVGFIGRFWHEIYHDCPAGSDYPALCCEGFGINLIITLNYLLIIFSVINIDALIIII